MNFSSEKMVADLNRLFKENLVEYQTKLNNIKNCGFKVYRNSNGEHVVKHNPNFIYEVYDGIFGKIFNK